MSAMCPRRVFLGMGAASVAMALGACGDADRSRPEPSPPRRRQWVIQGAQPPGVAAPQEVRTPPMEVNRPEGGVGFRRVLPRGATWGTLMLAPAFGG
jgi:hypothetical protein